MDGAGGGPDVSETVAPSCGMPVLEWSPPPSATRLLQSAAIRCALPQIASVSCRKGGISVAIEAGVEECILYLQSGHCPERAARCYIYLREPALLIEKFAAFGL